MPISDLFLKLPAALQAVPQASLRRVLDTALHSGGDFADIYIESRLAQSVMLEEGLIKETTEHCVLGAGIRVMAGAISGFAYTNDLTEQGLLQAAKTASTISRSGGRVQSVDLRRAKPCADVYDRREPGAETDLIHKLNLVRQAEAAAYGFDPRIEKVQVSLGDSMQSVLIANSEGVLAADVRPQMRLSVSATALDKGQRHSGHGSTGGRVGLTFFNEADRATSVGVEAAKEAVTLLGAVNPDAGTMPVVLGAKHSGVMIHEAVGHPMEADGHWKKTAVLHPFWQKKVASDCVSIVDDPTLPAMRGSLNVDDEGQTPQRTVLIDKGRFVGRLNDRLSAQKLDAPPNGHGRRDGYTSMPVPRMTNTFLMPGEAASEDIIKSVKHGFYAHSYQGGMVQGSGKFTFSINLGWKIEHGQLTVPVKNATLIGHNLDILKKIEMVGSDTGWFLGTCGKEGQSAAVTAGTPTLKISAMTVGGR